MKTKITSVSHLGQGEVKVEGKTMYVNHVLKDEVVEIALPTSKKEAQAKLVKVIEPSKFRVKAPCPIYEACGGCHLQHIAYEEQLSFKHHLVTQAFNQYHIPYDTIDPVHPMKDPYRYRNKLQVGFTLVNQKLVYGLYEEKSKQIVPMTSCMVHDSLGDEVLKTIHAVFVQHKIRPYDAQKRQGTIKHVLVKVGVKTQEVMVVFVTQDDLFPGRNNVVKALLRKHANIKTIIQNINSRDTAIVLGEKERVLYGKGVIEDVLLGLRFIISSRSFYQINPIQTEAMYQTAIRYANLNKQHTVLDAYSGIGTIGMHASKYVKKVVCVEQNKDAHKDAISNAKLNRISNVEFINEDATKYIEAVSKTDHAFDVVFMDPPRSGSTEAFLKAVIKLKPKRIVYVACDPFTQARDVKVLLSGGYEIKHISPFDMFSQTTHVESVVLLSLKTA